MLLGTSLIPKDCKIFLIVLNNPLIHLGIIVISRIKLLQIYAIALKEPLTNICIIGTLMPTVLKRIVIPVRATNTVIQVFRICIRDIPDTFLITNNKLPINILPPISKVSKK